MSIIHEALKKVQKNLQENQDKTSPSFLSGDYSAQAVRTAKAMTAAVWPIALLIAIGAALWLSFPLWQKFPAAAPAAVPPDLPPEQTPEPVVVQPTVAPPPAPALPEPVHLIINIQGIMDNNGTAVALINNKIYEVGDEIEGLKILAITENRITVLKNGKEETIRFAR